MFEVKFEDTLVAGAFMSTLDHALTTLVVAPRPLSVRRERITGKTVVVPGGFVARLPAVGAVLTIPMDNGYLVHLENLGDEVEILVEMPAYVRAPVDDDELGRLAQRSKDASSHPDRATRKAATRALQEAWSYRCLCDALANAFPGDGGPIIPTRWVTLSFEGRVHVDGVGTFAVEDEPVRYELADGRWVDVRRIGVGDGMGPAGTVEIVVAPAASI
jgi:hypothetical protein